ncbi:Auxin-responsive protein [Rhynchospora pubera]|uniref:Auxin-responsive protein n=1 Tax=Rhynchospora pubera TaxID=906938 RepID=A0AAV8HZY7_9POAL|nr:Auxin-responsive protein [Rhynchospora pubera]
MEEESKKKDTYPKLLHLIPTEREWKLRLNPKIANQTKLLDQEERKLELKLGLPGEDIERIEEKPSLHSLARSLNALNPSSSLSHGAKRGFSDAIKSKSQVYNARMGKELSLGTTAEREKNTQCQDKEANNSKPPAVAQSRNAPTPVVGWPPIRSFRKHIASSSKQLAEPQNHEIGANVPKANTKKGNFVKINMDGIPIGRKVDLSAYDSYEKLCSAIKELFKGLLEVQKDSSKNEDSENREHELFSCLLDGSGEYTLVYEDGEGDRVLASDVPWRLFISSAKRLRVLKSSELSQLPVCYSFIIWKNTCIFMMPLYQYWSTYICFT